MPYLVRTSKFDDSFIAVIKLDGNDPFRCRPGQAPSTEHAIRLHNVSNNDALRKSIAGRPMRSLPVGVRPGHI